MSNSFKRVASGQKPLSSDLNQLVDAFSGTIDVGPLSLFAALPTPSAPSVSVNTTSGVLNGAYKYVLVNVTGWIGTDGSVYVQGFAPSALSSSVSPASQQVNVTWTNGPSGTIAQALYRTTAGGSSAKFLAYFANNTTTSYTDNIADATLGTGMPTSYSGTAIPASVPASNTTGTTFDGKYISNVLRTDSGAPNPQTVATPVNFNGQVTVSYPSAYMQINDSSGTNGASIGVVLGGSKTTGIGIHSNGYGYVSYFDGTTWHETSIDASGNWNFPANVSTQGYSVLRAISGGYKVESGTASVFCGTSTNTWYTTASVPFSTSFTTTPVVIASVVGSNSQFFQNIGTNPSTGGFTMTGFTGSGGNLTLTFQYIAIGS